MDIIELDGSVKIYKTRIPFNKEELIKELYFNMDFNRFESAKDTAGRESQLIITSKNIEYVKSKAVNFITENLLGNKTVNYFQRNWVYVNDKNASYVRWHVHSDNVSKVIQNDWTYTFYVQMPDNLKNNEGKISFKIDETEYNILPEEGDLLVFPASLLHKPELSPMSTKERIVMAGNFVELDVNKILEKRKTSLV
jgi:hypothetical protein